MRGLIKRKGAAFSTSGAGIVENSPPFIPVQPAGGIAPAAFFRHGVIAPAAEGIAAQNPPGAQHTALERAMDLDRLQGILAAGGLKPAVGTQMGADAPLIEPDHAGKRPCQHVGKPALASNWRTTGSSWVLLQWGVRPRAT